MSRDQSAALMSLFQLHPVRIDGTAMFARAVSLALAERGYRSILCFPSPPEPAVREYLALPNVTIEADPHLFDASLIQSGRSFVRLVRRHRPTIVHLHFMGLVSPMPWLARICGVGKFFFTDHGSRPEVIPVRHQARWKNLVTSTLNYPISQVIAVSGFVLRSQLDLRIMENARFHLIYNGIDLDRAEAAAGTPENFRLRFGIPEDRVLVTQVSWLIEDKGVSDFVEAAAMVLAVCPNAHFCLSGEGTCLEGLRRVVNAAGIDSHFTFTGLLADPFFDGVYRASDVICQPSRWEEAFGWVLVEAMAFGKPVVATRAGAIPEIVRDHVTGFLVERRNPVQLSRRLIELVSEAGLRARMGAEGRRQVVERFALNRNVDEHLELYGVAGVKARNMREAMRQRA